MAVEEGLGEVVVLEGLEWPSGAIGLSERIVMWDIMSETHRRMISVATVSTQVIKSEYWPFLPLTVV